MNPLFIRMVLGGVAGYFAVSLYERLTGKNSPTTIDETDSIGGDNDSDGTGGGNGGGGSADSGNPGDAAPADSDN